MRRVGAACLAVALVGCGEKAHEPVKVIAAPRAAPVEAPAAAQAASATAIAGLPSALPAASRPGPRAVAAAASRGADIVRPGLMTGPAAPPRHQPGEPTGNDAFRRAIEAKRSSAPP